MAETANTPVHWWKPEWTWNVLKWLVGGLTSGLAAGIGFVAAWTNMQTALTRVQSAQEIQSQKLERLDQRQTADDIRHAADGVLQQQILDQLKELRADVQYIQRDQIGRVRRSSEP
jgi:hypothetical protein